jgi:signal transduction histidine kinase
LGDSDRIFRIFYNLIKNGIESYEGRGGVVNITSEDENNYIRFCIEDKGCGIPENIRARGIFRPLISDKKGGMGLGLWEVKELVKDMGGDIYFKTGSDGTKFFVKLRRYEK